jgi:DNA repair exonuclease SbcCD ATPase subunit
VSTAEYEENVSADVARVADACERSNEIAAAHQRISADLRDLNLRRYEYGSTAYDRAQAELNQHVASLAQMVTSLTLRLDRAHSRIEALEASGLGPHCAACREDHTTVAKRLDAALRRIEALERDIALDRAEAIKSEKRIQALELEVAKLKGPRSILEVIAERLPCGCRPPHCGGHQFSASPATAYPPLPDEGT